MTTPSAKDSHGGKREFLQKKRKDNKTEEGKDKEETQTSGLKIWALNTQGIGTEEKLEELRIEMKDMEPGIVLLSETWRKHRRKPSG